MTSSERAGPTATRADAYDVIRRDALARIERRRLRPDGDLEEVRLEATRGSTSTSAARDVGDEMPFDEPRRWSSGCCARSPTSAR